MYGRGNYAPQFGQGLQRPMPPYQQPPAGHRPPLQFQQGQSFPMQPVIQQGGPPHGAPPGGPGYPFVPPGSLNMPPQGLVHGGPPTHHPYPGSQQNFPSGTQYPRLGAPLLPPPSIGGPPRGLPPPPLQHPAVYGALGPRSTHSTQPGVHHISLPPPPPPPQATTSFFPSPNFELATQQLSGGSHMPLPPQPPPPPPFALPMVPDPPSSSLAGGSPITHGDVPGQNQILESVSIAEVKTDSGGEATLMSHIDLSLKDSVPLELPAPPPKPADEKVLRNIEVLCQFIAKNGSQFEEMALKNECGNPEFSFLVGGDPGSEASCAREYYLWMKKKYGILNDLDNGQAQKNLSERHADGEGSAVLNSSANVATVHSPDDSDVDMEDDFTQTDKEPEVYKSGEDLKSELVSTGEVLESQKPETMLLYMRDKDLAASFNDITQIDGEPKVYKSAEYLKYESISTREVLEIQNQETTLLCAGDKDLAASFNITQTDKEPEVYKSGEDLKSDPGSNEEILEMRKQKTLDDITQTDKEPEDYKSGDDLTPEPVSPGEMLEMQKQEVLEMQKQETLDNITQTDKEPEDYKSGDDLTPEPVSTGEMLEMQKQETMLLYSRNSSSALNSNPPIKSEEETEIKLGDSSGQLGSIDSPFRLIRNYASDDNSEDELPHEQGEAQAVSPPLKSGFSILCDDTKNGTKSESGFAQSVTACVDSLLLKQELAVLSESRGTSTKGDSSGKHGVNDRNGVEPSSLNTAFQGRYATGSSGDYAASKDIERKDKKSTSSALKMDEFGRLVKEGASDSESDDTRQVRRRGRRDRSRSRSRSPSDRKRRRSPRRSPHRRKGRRSRSRSWSPKRRRSRSRSPYRSGGDFGGEKLRRGKPQTQQCFDFLKGRCYRGASCRYLHLDEGKTESSRRYEGKHNQENVASARNSEFGNRVTSTVPLEHDDMKGIPSQPDTHDGDDLTSKTNNENFKVESIIDGMPNGLHNDFENSVADFKNSEGHREDPAHVQGSADEHMPHLPIRVEHSTFGMPSTSQTIHHSSAEAPQDDDGKNPTMVGSGKTDASTAETSLVPPGISIESYLGSNEPTSASTSISNFPHHISHSPLPPLASQAMNAPQQSNGLVEYNSITSSVSFPLQTVPLHVVPPYHAPLPSQHSHYPDPSNSPWSILPPSQPHPPHLIDSSISGAPLQFQQRSIPLRSDFQNQVSLRAHSGELAGHSQVGGFQYQSYQFPSHGHGSAVSFTLGVPPQPGLFSGGSNVMRSFPGGNMFAGDYSKQALHNNQLPQQRPPTYGPSLTAADSVPSHPGGSGISAHYNPYASTFDQPLSSKFSSAFAQERVSASGIKYDGSFSLSHGAIEGQEASGYGLNSTRAGGRLPKLGGDQYDPLFDSIEPSSKRAEKLDHAADNSDILKVGSHQKVLDVAEDKQKEVVATTSLENDEFGETADAEVGVVENGSLSDTDDDAIVAEGEIEIDQIKSGGNNETSKDSRSMKLFKVAVANFVKEVLKPQWRQGNMSKEVFKTIVKKTVDKVSGAMKNHRLPKSQAKIDHYIDSSRRKLTQLVEGYVSKYKS